MSDIKGANYTGTQLEKSIWDRLIEKKYTFIPPTKFKASLYLEQPIYSRKYRIGKGIYETPIHCDFILYHPKKHPDCLIIESIWQQKDGSVDLKFPYFILNIQQRHPHKTIVLLDGGGYKIQAEAWMKKQIGNNLLNVLNMGEFQKWANKGNI
jgi:hypothetical protein